MTPEEYALVEADRPFRTRRLPRYSGPTEKAIVNAQNELAFRKWHLDREGRTPPATPSSRLAPGHPRPARRRHLVTDSLLFPLRDLAKQASGRSLCAATARVVDASGHLALSRPPPTSWMPAALYARPPVAGSRQAPRSVARTRTVLAGQRRRPAAGPLPGPSTARPRGLPAPAAGRPRAKRAPRAPAHPTRAVAAGSGPLCRLPMSKVTLIASRRRRRSSPRSKRSMGRVALRRGFT